MAEGKNSFVLYSDLRNTVVRLPSEKQAQLFMLILDYVNDLDPETDDLILQIAFEPVKLQLKRDLKKWDALREKRSEAGRQGGLKSGEIRASNLKQPEANEASASETKQDEANEAVTVTATAIVTEPVNETATDILLEKETKGFRKPDVTEIEQHLIFEKGMSATEARKFAQEFHNHYESNGWKVGKNKMKNWKAALSGWITRAENFKPKNNGTGKLTFDEAARKYLDEFGG